LLDGAGADVDFDVDKVELPDVVAAALDELEPVVVAVFVLADLALAVEAVDFELALLASEDAADADDADGAVVAAVADGLALGVIDSTVFLLSMTNCWV
jgi:hypothetical protein